MAKKCIPGVLCIENMTLFILFFIVVVLLYLHFKQQSQPVSQPQVVVIKDLGGPQNTLMTPPQNDMLLQPPDLQFRGAIPVNIESRGPPSAYTQVGILTREKDLILPLMGRRLMRDKMQYYTISNTGNMNTKLPISKNGKSCTGEYGCDEIYNGDTVYVEGYSDTFRATIYENSRFNYIPYL
jgi:hypothetical protein